MISLFSSGEVIDALKGRILGWRGAHQLRTLVTAAGDPVWFPYDSSPPVPGDPEPALGTAHMWCTYVHTGKTFIHINENNIFLKN